MYTIKKILCMSLTNGVIAIGWFSIIYSIITAVVCMLLAILEALVWYTNLGVATGFLLIIAVKQRSDILLLPWLFVNAFHIFITTPLALIMLLRNQISEPVIFYAILMYLALLTIVICYGWIGVYSLYRLFKNEEHYGSSTGLRRRV